MINDQHAGKREKPSKAAVDEGRDTTCEELTPSSWLVQSRPPPSAALTSLLSEKHWFTVSVSSS